jgi:hypothetical protein
MFDKKLAKDEVDYSSRDCGVNPNVFPTNTPDSPSGDKGCWW